MGKRVHFPYKRASALKSCTHVTRRVPVIIISCAMIACVGCCPPKGSDDESYFKDGPTSYTEHRLHEVLTPSDSQARECALLMAELLSSESEEEKKAASRVFDAMFVRAKAAVPELRRLLFQGSTSDKPRIIRALGAIGPAGVPILLEGAKSEDPTIKKECLVALSKIMWHPARPDGGYVRPR